MPINHAIWTVDAQPQPLVVTRLPSEAFLEQMIINRPEILSGQWMLIGQQEHTGFGGRIDLLAIAPDASLVLIELKRDRTPRDCVAQALDYAAWVSGLTSERIAQIYSSWKPGRDLRADFRERFGSELDEESLNESHQIVLVASELDAASERIVQYLNDRHIAINVLFFQVFSHGDELLLSRAWLIDPGDTQSNVAASPRERESREPWNGEFYVSYGGRSWEDARRYGFISAGGGRWYTQTLNLLSPGDRVWVNIPKTGYVGVGLVRDAARPITELMLSTPQGVRPALEVLSDGPAYAKSADDPDRAERFVAIDWLDTKPIGQAVNEVGFFGNQNTVCQPTTPKWRHTVERLKQYFPRWDARDGSPRP